ncbi:hypothetical protein PENSPDRAFT_223959 [Peniophora sp. CONT]|nr:hypothetical protein PENSPDRAFT_223959 [Peniophora sp. CONT]
MSTDIIHPGRAQLKARLDQRFKLSVCFEEYHLSRLEGHEGTNPSKPSETTGSLRALYQVVQSLHTLITNWTHAAPFTPGDANDPQTFWDLAQPWQELTDDERADILQTYNFTCGPAAVAPGLIDIYVQLILDPRFFKTPPLIIDCVLWSFGALFAVACRDPKGFITGPAQSSASSLILVHTDEIWQHFWENQESIPLRPQSARDAQKHMPWDVFSNEYGFWPEPFSRLIAWYSYLYDHHNEYLQSHATPAQREREPAYPRYRDTCMPDVGLYLWVFGSPDDGAMETTVDPHHMLAPLMTIILDNDGRGTTRDKKDTMLISRETVCDGIGADAFFKHFIDEMRRLHIAEYKTDPGKCVSIMAYLAQTYPLLPFLSKYNIWRPIVAMVNFHVRNQRPLHNRVWVSVQHLFWYIGQCLAKFFDEENSDDLYVRVDGADIADYMARSIDLVSEKDVDMISNPGGWVNLHTQILRYSEQIASSKGKVDHRSELRNQFVTELTTRISSLWRPSLQRLETARDRDQFSTSPLVDRLRVRVLKNWRHLGTSIGLDSASERKLYCSWGWCEYYADRPPGTLLLKTCKGCGEVKYCSRTCQVSHWKQEHKGQCGKRLHAS